MCAAGRRHAHSMTDQTPRKFHLQQLRQREPSAIGEIVRPSDIFDQLTPCQRLNRNRAYREATERNGVYNNGMRRSPQAHCHAFVKGHVPLPTRMSSFPMSLTIFCASSFMFRGAAMKRRHLGLCRGSQGAARLPAKFRKGRQHPNAPWSHGRPQTCQRRPQGHQVQGPRRQQSAGWSLEESPSKEMVQERKPSCNLW